MRRSVPLILAVLLAVSLWSTAFGEKRSVPQLQRDWSRFPVVVEVETDADIYVLSDVHADYDRLVNLLVAANLISGIPTDPMTVDWTGGNSILVITGDLID